MNQETEDTTIYKVVINHEEQYSIWPSYRENPLGWKDVGKSGPKAECLEYIGEVWTDMRPLSLRKKMEEMEQQQAEAPEPVAAEGSDEPDDLVQRLCDGEHPVEASLRPSPSVDRFKECLDRGYVHIKFTGTRGGTELGIRMDESTDLSKANFDQSSGTAHVEGQLTLNYQRVRCIADIELDSLKGTGRLELVDS